jgi:hypothetical protein
MRNGTWPPLTFTQGCNISTMKPRLFETWFPKDGNEANVDREEASGRRKTVLHSKGEQEWDDTMVSFLI